MPLHWAALNGSVGVVRLFVIQGGVNANAKNNDDVMPLDRAASMVTLGGKAALGQILCRRKRQGWLDIPACSSGGWSNKITQDCAGRHGEGGRLLIEFRANANTKSM